MATILLTADWHLDCGPGHGPRFHESVWALKQIRAIIKSLGGALGALVAAGDVLDKRNPTSSTIAKLMDLMRFLRDPWSTPIPMLFIQGQHDRSSPPWLTVAGTGTWHLAVRPYEVPNGPVVAGVDFTEPDRLPEKLSRLGSADIVVMHQTWHEFVRWVPASQLLSLKDALGALSFKPDLVVTGDFHASRLLDLDGVRVLSPGYLTSMDTRLMEPPTCWLLCGDEMHQLVLHGRPVIRVPAVADIDDAESAVLEVMEQGTHEISGGPVSVRLEIPPELRRPVVYVSSDPSSVEKARMVVERLRSLGAMVHLRRTSNTTADTPDSIRELDPAVSIEDVIRSEFPPDRARDLIRFLRARDLRAEVAAWWKEKTGVELNVPA